MPYPSHPPWLDHSICLENSRSYEALHYNFTFEKTLDLRFSQWSLWRVHSSGIWLCVVRQNFTDVSEASAW
jgi:hypothetical protein